MKQIMAWIMILALCFGGLQATVAEENYSDPELISAVSLGIGQYNADDPSVSYAEFFSMLDKAVELADATKLPEWKALLPEARTSGRELLRCEAMLALYFAGETLGEGYVGPNDGGRALLHCEEVFPNGGDGDFGMSATMNCGDYDLFPEYVNDPAFTTKYGDNFYIPAAYYSAISRLSLKTNKPLMELDAEKNGFRPEEVISYHEALRAVIRLLDSYEELVALEPPVYVPVKDAGAFNKNILTDALLENAEEMPEVSLNRLPYFTGVQIDRSMNFGKEPFEEKEFRLISELGFNFVRLSIRYQDYFSSDVTEADLSALERLDKVISYGLQYGLHISMQMNDFPGHVQANPFTEAKVETDYYTNPRKQAQVEQIWAVLAERYKGISNNVLSFMINHEPSNPQRSDPAAHVKPYTHKDIQQVSERLIHKVKVIDPDRFQFFNALTEQTPVTDFMADAEVGQTGNFTAQEYAYWSLITDFESSAGYVPNWPFYNYYPYIKPDKPSIRINGFLPGGTSFHFGLEDKQKLKDTSLEILADGVLVQSIQLSNNAKEASISLDKKASSVEIRLSNAKKSLLFTSFVITLPEPYVSAKYYVEAFDAGAGAGDLLTEISLVTNSEIHIPLNTQYRGFYNKLEDDFEKISYQAPFIFENHPQADITINEDLTFQTPYGYNKDAIDRIVCLWQKQLHDLNIVGMNYETYALKYIAESTYQFYDDAYAAFNKHRLGWLHFDWASVVNAPSANLINAEVSFVPGYYEMDMGMVRILQKYLSKERAAFTVASEIAKGETSTFTIHNAKYVSAETWKKLADAAMASEKTVTLVFNTTEMVDGEEVISSSRTITEEELIQMAQ